VVDETQKALVRESFAKVAPLAEAAGPMLYERIFAIDPDLRRPFPDDLKTQGRKVISVLAVAVANLDRLEDIAPTVCELGRRHVRYGVSERDYDTIGLALIETLEAALDDGFTTQIRDVWTACYRTIAAEMKAAAATVTQDA
jgi:hemoglobin-like flavoprotein